MENNGFQTLGFQIDICLVFLTLPFFNSRVFVLEYADKSLAELSKVKSLFLVQYGAWEERAFGPLCF